MLLQKVKVLFTLPLSSWDVCSGTKLLLRNYKTIVCLHDRGSDQTLTSILTNGAHRFLGAKVQPCVRLVQEV